MANPTLAAMRSHYHLDPTDIAAAIVALDGLGETTISERYSNFIDLVSDVFDDSLRGNCVTSDICLRGLSNRSYRCSTSREPNNVGEVFETINNHTGAVMTAIQDNTDPLYYLLSQRLHDDRKRWFIGLTGGDPTEEVGYDENQYEAVWPLIDTANGRATNGMAPSDADNVAADFFQPKLSLPLGDVSKNIVSGSVSSPVDLFIYYLEASVAYKATDDAEILLEVSRDGGSFWDPILQEVITGTGVSTIQGAVPFEYHTTLQWRVSASTNGVAAPSTAVSMSDISLNWNSQYPLIRSFG